MSSAERCGGSTEGASSYTKPSQQLLFFGCVNMKYVPYIFNSGKKNVYLLELRENTAIQKISKYEVQHFKNGSCFKWSVDVTGKPRPFYNSQTQTHLENKNKKDTLSIYNMMSSLLKSVPRIANYCIIHDIQGDLLLFKGKAACITCCLAYISCSLVPKFINCCIIISFVGASPL